MTDPASRNPSAPNRAKTTRGGAGGTGKPAKRGKGDRRSREANARRKAQLHQSRVLAMQALYEDDLTDHALDDILQHIGEDHRRTFTEAFAGVRSGAVNVVETLVFLARQADADDPQAALKTFDDASMKALRGLSGVQDEPEGESAEEDVLGVRASVEALVEPLLKDFRASARRHLEASLTAPPAETELASHLAELSGDGQDDVDSLATQQRAAIARIRETLGEEERASRVGLMEMIQRTGRIARGVRAQQADIDPRIERAAPAFPIPQLASIDRNVLRVALYELFHEPGVPYKVVINEAVEIAKRYGGPNSGKFVNGVLRTIAQTLPAERTAGQ